MSISSLRVMIDLIVTGYATFTDKARPADSIFRFLFPGFYGVYLETAQAENVTREVRRGKSKSFLKLQINGFLTKTATCKKIKRSLFESNLQQLFRQACFPAISTS